MTVVSLFVVAAFFLWAFIHTSYGKKAPMPGVGAQSLRTKGQTSGGHEPSTAFDRVVKEIEEIGQVNPLQLQHVRELSQSLHQIYPSRITSLQQKQIELIVPQALEGRHVSWQLEVDDVRERPTFSFPESVNLGGFWVHFVEYPPLMIAECQTFRTDVLHLQPKQSVSMSGRIAKVRIQWPTLILMVLDAIVSPSIDNRPKLPDRVEFLDTSVTPRQQPAHTGPSGEPSYQTAPLTAYSTALRERAEELFSRVAQTIGHRAKRYKGSFSIFASTSNETAAKIVIYQQGLGRENGMWPTLADGVYVLVRCNGAAGRAIWEGKLLQASAYRQRLDPRKTLGIAPKHDERFTFFWLRIEDNIQDVAELLVICASA